MGNKKLSAISYQLSAKPGMPLLFAFAFADG
jgi:hypothetical protein